MKNVIKMNKLDFVSYLINANDVDAFYFYYEKKLLSHKFNLKEMKTKFIEWYSKKNKK